MNTQGSQLIASSGPGATLALPRAVSGRFQRLRVALRALLLGIFFAAPWPIWDGRQAILFELPERQFHIFGWTFWPSDFHLLAFVLIMAAFALFAVTNWIGRVFCGYACPHSVFFSLFVAIERGLKRKRGPRTARILTWLAWSLIGLITAITIVGLFVPVRVLLSQPMELGGWPLFWLAFFTIATVFAGGLLRERVCIYMCPYARFQSVMFDRDTTVVAYDANRGEPRGPRRQRETSGDCIDCTLCVQVCPTGIDIRNGLQYACIGCGLCADACDRVMDQLGRSRGLIAYRSERSLSESPRPKFRPRLVGYGLSLGVMFSVFLILLTGRPELALDVERDRQALFTEVRIAGATAFENSYRLSVHNRDSQPRDVTLDVNADSELDWIGPREISLEAGERREVAIRLRAAADRRPVRTINFEAHDAVAERRLVTRESRFFTGSSTDSPAGMGG